MKDSPQLVVDEGGSERILLLSVVGIRFLEAA